jgi:predicted DNA-binding protein (MmcQ/YjbR family)
MAKPTPARLRKFVMKFPATTEETPFHPDNFVYKVAGKMFASISPKLDPPRMNLKCDPDDARKLREAHEAIVPGYHMNKQHWNTVDLDGTLDEAFLQGLIHDSFELVVDGLPKKVQKQLRGG